MRYLWENKLVTLLENLSLSLFFFFLFVLPTEYDFLLFN